MKIDFEDAVRVLDLEQNITLKQATAIQDYTGLTVFGWQERLAGIGDATEEGFKADPAGTLRRMPMFTDPAWIKGMAAAHWLMLAQAGDDPPPLDDDYDCDVLGFAVAFFNAMAEDVKAKAKRVPDKPDPTARPGRRAPSSRRTAAPKKTAKAEIVPLPRLTGS